MHIIFIELDYKQPKPTACRFSDMTWPLASALVERGHQVTVVGPYLSGAVSPNPSIALRPVPAAVTKRQNILTQIVRAWQLGRAGKQVIGVDIYHVHQSVMAASMTWLGLGSKTVWHGHSNYYYRTRLGKVYDWQMASLIRHSTTIAAQKVHVIALGQAVIPYWQVANFPTERIASIPNGMIWPTVAKEDAWSSSAWQGKRLKMLYVGRLARDKGGQAELLSALSYLSGESIGLAILGDGELRAALERQVQENGLQEMVTFCVPHHEVLRAMAAADLYILTSVSEMLPRTILEAWSLRTPVMATDVGAIGDYLIDQQNGYLLTSHAPEYIAQRLREALKNEAERLNYGRAGWETSRSMTWDKVVVHYEQLYQKVI